MMQTVVSVAAADKPTFAGLDASPTMQAAVEDMQVLASITEPLLDVLLNSEEKISELLRGLARVAFLLLFVYRMKKTRFKPGQLDHDLQATIRLLFYVVLEAQVRCPRERLYLWMIGTDGLENLFAIVRTLTHASNVDAKEAIERFGAVIGVEQVDAVDILRGHPSYEASVNRETISELQKVGVTTFLPFGATEGLAGGELDAFLHATESGPGEITSSCEVDGKQIHKQRALTEFMGPAFQNASRDRLKRLRGYTAGQSGSATGSRGVGGRGEEAAGIGNTDSRGIVVGDPFAMLVATPGMRPAQYALGLFSCTKAPMDEQAQDGSPVFKGRLMKLQRSKVAPAVGAVRLGEGDGTSSSDFGEDGAPAKDSWQHWGDLGLHKGELSCKCRLVLALDPDDDAYRGGHILKDKVSTACGFCGGVGRPTTIHDPPGKARPLVHSTCPSAPRSDARQEAVALNLSSARAGSDTSLCTNMVFKCFFCSQYNYIWKYSMSDHITRCHQADVLVAEGTGADNFKETCTISESEKAKDTGEEEEEEEEEEDGEEEEED
ncbi:unnamed protein product [Ectocarpus sp. CCAP 1310/34]|nr:unnamed protein product [Ectocarpus sp. CCAP 1310/34]